MTKSRLNIDRRTMLKALAAGGAGAVAGGKALASSTGQSPAACAAAYDFTNPMQTDTEIGPGMRTQGEAVGRV